jgi:capsular exopolysaccharide synthesis family protein
MQVMMGPTQLPAQEVMLGDYLDVVRRRKWTILLTLVAAIAAGFLVVFRMRPVYRVRSRLLVQTVAPQASRVDTGGSLGEVLAMAQPLSMETQIQMLQDRPFLERVFRRSGVQSTERGMQPPTIMAAAVPDTSLIDVTVQASDRRMAMRVADAVTEEYQLQLRHINLKGIQNARQFMEGEVQKAQRELARAERELFLFRRHHRISERTVDRQNRSLQLGRLEARVVEVTNDITRVEGQIRQLEATVQQEPIEKSVFAFRENVGIGVMQGKLADLEMQRAALLEEYQETSPKVVALDAQIDRLRRQLASEPEERRVVTHVVNPLREELMGRLKGLKVDLAGLQAAQVQLQREQAKRRPQVDPLEPWEIQLSQLTGARDGARESHLMLADRLQDLRIRESARRGTVYSVEGSLPPATPVSPRRRLVLVVFAALGLLGGTCLAFLQEFLDDAITTQEKVERLLRLPILGRIPPIGDGGRRLLTALPADSGVAETYRSLRTNVGFAGIDSPLQTLLVASPNRGEGKSTTAVNLAIAMAMEKRAVILVDADLRGPTLHHLLDVPSAPGLTDVLMAHETVDHVLCATGIPGLLVLPSGSVPPNPAELLNSEPMTHLIADLRQMAEIIVFDTPPCLLVTDAQVLAAKVDGVLLVAEMGKTRTVAVEEAHELFARARVRTVGLVLNKMRHAAGRNQYRRNGSAPHVEHVTARSGTRALPRVLSVTEQPREEHKEVTEHE